MSSSPRISAVLALTVTLVVAAAYLEFADKQSDTGVEDRPPIAPSAQSAKRFPAAISEIPEAELRAALTDVCAEAVDESKDKEWTQDDIQTETDQFNELRANLSERLSVSSSTEHLHTAALLENDPGKRIELLERAISSSPSDPFLLWSAVQVCSEYHKSVSCPLQDWEQRLIAVDGQNSESWIRIAANRDAAGKHDAALVAMRHASTGSDSRVYLAETLEMMERALAAVGDDSFPKRAGMAAGIAISSTPVWVDYVIMCKERSAQSVDWAYACLAYGELAENQGESELGVRIALAIQKLSLEALGDLDNAAIVEKRLQLRRKEWEDSIREHNPRNERLIFSNSALFSAYLAELRSYGEKAARDHLANEIERLLIQDPKLACEPF